MKLRLVNHYEELTFGTLKPTCERHGAHVFPKVRLGDVFPLSGSGISNEQYSYALRAHFDFLITDSNYHPLFSVEFDGPLHKTNSRQKERDGLKNELCKTFSHSLLRINANYLSKKYRGLDLLTYFVEAWFLSEAFDKAQQNGIVPYEEDFDMTFIISDESRTEAKWPYWISLDIQITFQKMHKDGLIGQMAPSYTVGVDDEGNYRCLAWIVIDAKNLLAISTGIQAQKFQAVSLCDLIEMLSMFELYEKLQETLKNGNRRLQDRKFFYEKTLTQFESKYRAAGSGHCSPTV